MRESHLRKLVQLALTGMGARLFRNNVGLAHYPDGSTVRYGLCVGSSDLIGWTSVTITPDMVGRRVAVFTALELKTGKQTTTEAQDRFLARVREAGGIAGEARDPDQAARAVRDWLREGR